MQKENKLTDKKRILNWILFFSTLSLFIVLSFAGKPL